MKSYTLLFFSPFFLFSSLGLAQGWAHLGQGPGERKKGKREKKGKSIGLHCTVSSKKRKK